MTNSRPDGEFSVAYAHQVPVHGGSQDDALMRRFWAYEAALATNDVDALDELFEQSPETMRGDANGLLVGHERISQFRSVRGGAPARTVVQVQRRDLGPETALLVAVTRMQRGGCGQQTQLWRHKDGAWRVSAAYVSVPAPSLDTTMWRIVGDPLVPATKAGLSVPSPNDDDRPAAADQPPQSGQHTQPAESTRSTRSTRSFQSTRSSAQHPRLDGMRIAVKDIYAVAGQRIGAGSPDWLAAAPVQPRHAWVVQALLDAGASVQGIARTDEFAYSLAGTNAHYGTPPNPSAPHRISGGSSSGSASAVALGQADIGLGTDTGGSIRVPSGYQGLWGIRTTHDLVSRDGLLPLAQSFDTVGWMTRNAADLLRVTQAVIAPGADTPTDQPLGTPPLVLLTGLLELAEPEVARAVRAAAERIGAVEEMGPAPHEAHAWRTAFQTVQAAEAWANHGQWVQGHRSGLAPDVAARFAAAQSRTAPEIARARQQADGFREELRGLVGQRMVILPSASSVAPDRVAATTGGPMIEAARAATMALTSLAGLAGLPAVSVPVWTDEGLPAGLCLVSAPGTDLALVQRAAELLG